MTRMGRLTVLMTTLVVGLTFVAAVVQAAEGPRGGFGGGRGSLLGLLRLEQVQKEMKLSAEQTAKVKEIVEKLGAEMRDQFATLRDIEDREQRQAKMDELNNEFDGKIREQLRDVLEREQTMRLYQIRMQVRAVVDSLSSERLAGRLEITEDQKSKLAGIRKEMLAKQWELFGSMRDASEDQRRDAFQKMRQIRSEADEQALGILTAAQKESFESMKGEKFELEMPQRQQ